MKLAGILVYALIHPCFHMAKQERCIKVFVLNKEWESPIAITTEVFWLNFNNIDSVSVCNEESKRKIAAALGRLTVTKEYEIDSRWALVNGGDTLYADSFLKYWKKGGRVYRDKSGLLNKYLRALVQK